MKKIFIAFLVCILFLCGNCNAASNATGVTADHVSTLLPHANIPVQQKIILDKALGAGFMSQEQLDSAFMWLWSNTTIPPQYAQYTGCNHMFAVGTCQTVAKCTICGLIGGYGDHNYSIECSFAHCTSAICSYCGDHKTECGGDHVYSTCSHCKAVYCTKCTTHTCSCNTDMSCNDPHCKGIKWCSYCGTHTCVGCDTKGVCKVPHCGLTMCSVCEKHTCIGGHKYKWVTNNSTVEKQTHTYKCSISGCTATNGSHAASWGIANSNHTSTCKSCSLTYTHKPVWSSGQKNATEPHQCVWSGGCVVTHTPTWGNYYKVNGGADGDNDGGPHTRKCSTCGVLEIYHNYTTEPWTWLDTTKHRRTCKTCGLKQAVNHSFSKYESKDENATNSQLYKHWMLCAVCDSTHKEVDELHIDNGHGICTKCGQVLWRITTTEGKDITTATLNEESSKKAFREAKREERIKILEVVDDNGSPKTQYIKTITGPETLVADSNNEIIITKNGTYEFETGRGGIASFVIDNISRDILIEAILTPATSTTETVTITVRTKGEEKFNKKIYIKEGKTSISDAELNGGSNPYVKEKSNISKNGIYYFTARDTAGNVREFEVVVDNIIKGQATVAISNDVFINGYVFTDILVNPDKNWEINTSDDFSQIVNAKVYKAGSITGSTLNINNIKLIKVLDAQRNEIEKQGALYGGAPGTYYIQVAVGGNVFSQIGTYIVDLEKVNLPSESNIMVLQGKNRIIVEVQDLKDLT